MQQKTIKQQGGPFAFCMLIFISVGLSGGLLNAGDRFHGFVPTNPSDTLKEPDEKSKRDPSSGAPSFDDHGSNAPSSDDHVTDDPVAGLIHGTPTANRAWTNYRRLWREHHADPANPIIRRYLGLRQWSQRLDREAESEDSHLSAYNIKTKPGRAAPRYLKWKPRRYRQWNTPHFTIHSKADRDATLRAAQDLEDAYWLWTQWFFPFWIDAPKVTLHLGKLDPNRSIADQLSKSSFRLTPRSSMQVVVFRDANQYVESLRQDNPGVERSTGFYHDGQRTTFLYSNSNDRQPDESRDVRMRETLQHELIHQLFREASLSKLGRLIPGEQRDFWLVEGIAGYFESMVIDQGVASVGGWDAPRMQFARHRVLASGDVLPMGELRRDGRFAAQGREDLARWYAHAITRVHWLLDGQQPENTHWLFHQLAQVYDVDLAASGFPRPPSLVKEPVESDHALSEFLLVTDEHLRANPPLRTIRRLCLTRCQVTSMGIASLKPLKHPVWIDLSYCDLRDDAIKRLLPNPRTIKQLSLENTAVTDDLAPWLEPATALEEVDLSWTRVGDACVQAMNDSVGLEVAWLTGTDVTDRGFDSILKLPNLLRLDVQRSKVGSTKFESLRDRYPQLQINPLELRTEHP